MLTNEEKEILAALREIMDDEQKEALDEMSDEEKKEVVKEAKRVAENEGGGDEEGGNEVPKGCLEKIRDLRDCPWGEVWREGGRWVGNGQARLQLSLVKLLLKILFFWL